METLIYNKIYSWIEDDKEFKSLRSEINGASGDYKVELIKNYRKMDFFRTFLTICKLATKNIMIEREGKGLIKNIVGSVMGRLVFETSDINQLNRVFSLLKSNDRFIDWINNRRVGSVWILNTFIDKKIEILYDKIDLESKDRIGDDINEPDWDLTFIDYAKYEFALVSGSSYTDVESMMARGISRTTLCNILYSFIMVRRLMESLGDNLLLNWYADNDLFSGYSGINHFFDGIIVLDKNDLDHPWLFKCVSMCHNPLQSIESIESKMDDIGVKRCILFLPMYPSQNAWRYFVHTYATKNYEIMMLYLHDLYEILRLDNVEVIDYLRSKRI